MRKEGPKEIERVGGGIERVEREIERERSRKGDREGGLSVTGRRRKRGWIEGEERK